MLQARPAERFFLVLTLAAFAFGSQALFADALQGIHVTGRAEIAVEPDMVRMTLQVSAEAQDAVAVKRRIDEVTRSVLQLTDRFKISRRDVTAAVVNLSVK